MGYLFSSSDIRNQLQKLNKDYENRKSWEALYGAVDLSSQQALSSSKFDYSKSISDAYATAYKNKSLIANSALGSGFKANEFASIEDSLRQAYNSYRQTYNEEQTSILSSADKARSAIDTALTTEAENTKAYIDSFYDYIADLHQRSIGTSDTEADEYLANLFRNDPLWNRYTTNVLDSEGNPITLTDSQGNTYNETQLLSKQELLSQFYDDDKTLNDKGIDFYDQMLNALSSAEGSKYSFGSYLSEANPKLFDWSRQRNPYSYTDTGTNEGAVKKLLGLESTDYTYKFIERYGGVSKEEVESSLSDLTNDLININNNGEAKNTKKALQSYSAVINNVKSYTDKLGITKDVEKDLGMTFDELIKSIEERARDVKYTSSEGIIEEVVNAWNEEGYEGEGILSKFVAKFSAAADALVTNLIPYVFSGSGTIGKYVDTLKPTEEREERRKSNEQLVQDVEKYYLDLIKIVTEYSK